MFEYSVTVNDYLFDGELCPCFLDFKSGCCLAGSMLNTQSSRPAGIPTAADSTVNIHKERCMLLEHMF